MKVDIDNIVSISEANQNFSKVARLVDEKGTVVILKNNTPKYILVEYNLLEKEETTEVVEDALLEDVARKILSKHKKAFDELAK